jgi:predicted O-linked N-acetylglucosamine transferase (SPINDLY family)
VASGVYVDEADGSANKALAHASSPVPLSWLGCLGTCDHDAIEHRITDRWVESARTQHGFVEQAIGMNRPSLCYRPASDAQRQAAALRHRPA